MYEQKALLRKFEINVPSCMYAVKIPYNNCQLTDVSEATCVLERVGEQIQNVLKDCFEMSDLELRQEKLLEELNQLKNKLLNMRNQIGLQEMCQKTSNCKAESNSEILCDIVVNANVNCIPYGLLALRNTWKDVCNIEIEVYCHSSVSSLSEEAIDFQSALSQGQCSSNKTTMRIALIWKKCSHTEMIISPTSFIPIYNEINILRYLSRIGPPTVNYEETPYCNEIDTVLDICYKILQTPSKEKQQLLRLLSNRLKDGMYFGGKTICIADIALYSAIRTLKKANFKDIPESLKKWYQRTNMI